jgi:hypothetical protein
MKKVTYLWFRGFGLILSCFFFTAAAGIFAQESSGDGSGARVYHAEGPDFILAVGEQRNMYPLNSLGRGGLDLNPQDMIQTGADSFVEIQLIPGETLIKVAENTSIIYNGMGRDGASVSFSLLYGRIRVVRGAEEGNRDLTVQSGNGVVYIREGDVGLDYILRPGLSITGSGIGQPLLRIYGFSGTAELIPLITRDGSEALSPAGAGDRARIRVSGGETLAQEVLSGFSFTERKSLDRDIVDYWILNNFNGAAPLNMPGTSLSYFLDSLPEPDNQILYAPPDYSAFLKTNRIKNGGIAAGLLFSSIGIGLQSYGYYRIFSGSRARAESLIYAGYANLGLGFFTLILTLIPRPALPPAYDAH